MAGIAGSVSPVFRDEGYLATATYDFYHAIIYNNKLYFCRQDGTIGHEPQAVSDEYWFLSLDGTFADAASLGGETAAQWQGKLDNIQTASKGTLSQAGWYRVADYNGRSVQALQGSTSNSCIVSVKKAFNTLGTEEYLLRCKSVYQSQTFVLMDSEVNGTQLITKIRYVQDNSTKAYLEIYYAQSVTNIVTVSLLDVLDGEQNRHWQAITPILTSESVDGVTVTCTYDIPANAKPTTNLDIAAAMEAWTFERNTFTDQTAFQNFIDNYSNDFARCTSYELVVSVAYSNDTVLGGGQWKIIGNKITDEYETQLAILYDNPGFVIKGRSKYGGTWGTFGALATTADLIAALAGYLPLNGGGKVKSSAHPIILEATNADYCAIPFRSKGQLLGYLGLDGVDNPAFLTSIGMSLPLLHAGNSNPIVKSTTAPSDTTAIWIDTTNKKTKAYIDGAWTIIA